MSSSKQQGQNAGLTSVQPSRLGADVQSGAPQPSAAFEPGSSPDQHPSTPRELLALQRTIGNRGVARLLGRQTTTDVKRAFDPAVVERLKTHIAGKAHQQQLISGEKHGQGMAEELVREGRSDAFGVGETPASEQQGISAALRRLVDFTRFDDSSSVSVLEKAEDGGLSDADKWNVIKVNTDFMQYIEPGMTINKIIPDATVQTIVQYRTMSRQFGNGVMGSVAHKANYDQGLTGNEAVSNFGLDYGGYTDVNDQGQKVKMGGDYSSYVKQTGTDASGKDTIAGVRNVFYVQLKLEAKDIPHVKVPIHSNIIEFANAKMAEISAALADPQAIAAMVADMGAKDGAEIIAMLQQKQDTLTKFLAVAHFTDKMAVSKKLSGKKNEDDPLTNLGITKPGARLQNQFGTINQEYHLGAPVKLPQGSGLFLKDRTGNDKQVGTLIDEGGQLKWGELLKVFIHKALQENEDFRKA